MELIASSLYDYELSTLNSLEEWQNTTHDYTINYFFLHPTPARCVGDGPTVTSQSDFFFGGGDVSCSNTWLLRELSSSKGCFELGWAERVFSVWVKGWGGKSFFTGTKREGKKHVDADCCLFRLWINRWGVQVVMFYFCCYHSPLACLCSHPMHMHLSVLKRSSSMWNLKDFNLVSKSAFLPISFPSTTFAAVVLGHVCLGFPLFYFTLYQELHPFFFWLVRDVFRAQTKIQPCSVAKGTGSAYGGEGQL